MQLYNKLSRKIEELTPQQPGVFTFYSCGFTVYDYAHIGHGRKYTNDDLLKRTLIYLGNTVNHVQNITDVGHLVSDDDAGEDKMEKGARKYGKTVWDIAEFYTQDFMSAMLKLNIIPPNTLCRATDHIKQMIVLVQTLFDKGYAYDTPEAVYFDTSKFEGYGKLSGQRLEDKQSSREDVYVDPNKINPTDFSLWFKRKGRFADHTMHWESPWGDGFPGWHVECSAMAMEYLGESIDIHSGGIDHIPVHHENEIAQSEAATGKQFVKYWFHTYFLLVDGVKMSKSLNNFYTVDDVIKKGLDPLSLRYLYLQTHYRQTMNFTWDSLTAAQNALKKLQATARQLKNNKDQSPGVGDTEIYREQFKQAISNDLQFSQALAVMFEMLKSSLSNTNKLKLLLEFDDVFGLNLENVENIEIPDEIQQLALQRQKAKEEKDFRKSDTLRKEIIEKGYSVEDTSDGYTIKKV